MFLAVAFLSYDVAAQDKDLGLGWGGLRPSGRCHNVLPSSQEVCLLYFVTNNVPAIIFCLQRAEKISFVVLKLRNGEIP